MSKGSKQRPVDKKRFDEGFDRIFKKTKQNRESSSQQDEPKQSHQKKA